ncbi:MAG: N-acetylmuramoyl-L-alanine amidase [Firmicutes bacterium]|nr:N-acetylmuramoyl-L-alanine amidase [Bacillota bacterium]
MYELKRDILYAGHRLRPGGSFRKTSVTIHSTANPMSTAENERKWLDNPANTRDAAWHYIAGEGVVIQSIPDVEEAWHCGKKTGNTKSVGIEMIESGDRRKVIETCAEFTADVLKKHGLSVKNVKKHFDWTGKNCPRILIDPQYIKNGMDWEYFMDRVRFFMIDGEPEKIKMIVNGEKVEVERILKDGYNFIKLRDLAGILGYSVGSMGNMPVLTAKG